MVDQYSTILLNPTTWSMDLTGQGLTAISCNWKKWEGVLTNIKEQKKIILSYCWHIIT